MRLSSCKGNAMTARALEVARKIEADCLAYIHAIKTGRYTQISPPTQLARCEETLSNARKIIAELEPDGPARVSQKRRK
jgi:hypothetical protein